jgi:hypothetical protein
MTLDLSYSLYVHYFVKYFDKRMIYADYIYKWVVYLKLQIKITVTVKLTSIIHGGVLKL